VGLAESNGSLPFMTHINCRLTAKNRDQLQNPMLGNRVWATFFSYPTNFTVTRFAKHNNARNTHRSFDHEFDPSIRHSYNHRHALPRARKLQNVQYLVTLFSTHLHHCIHTTDFPQHTGSLCSLIQIMHDDLHWLNVADRVTYKLGVIMHRCRHGKAPQYLVTVAHWSPMLLAGSVSGQ